MSRQLGALSGVAMVIIVLVHALDMGAGMPADLGYSQAPAWVATLLKSATMLRIFAVPIFLFISGSFLAYAARMRTDGHLSWKFLSNSLQRILVPYVLWSLLFYLLVYVQFEEKYTLLGYVKNLLVGYPFHFIPLLVFFYILSPLLVQGARRVPVVLLLVVGGYQLFLLNLHNPAVLGITFPEWSRTLTPPGLNNTFSEWGIYFPLGLVFGLHTTVIRPVLLRLRYLIAIVTITLILLVAVDTFAVAQVPQAHILAPLLFMFIVPVLDRNTIPAVRAFEYVGRHAYGLYLSHLIVQDLLILSIAALAPQLFDFRALLLPVLFLTGLGLPLIVMKEVGRRRSRVVYHYVFG